MIRPTGRMVLIFSGGIPLALLVVVYDPALWVLSFAYGALVLLATGTDVLLAFQPRLLNVKVAVPDRIYIGERAALTATIAATRWQRTTRFELLAEQRGDVEPAAIVSAELPVGQEARIVLPVVPRRRGQVTIARLWLRWRGPLGLAEFTRRVPVDRVIAVLPNVRGVQSAALQFFAQ
jgi:uncharacterized protein (DUF58 family)